MRMRSLVALLCALSAAVLLCVPARAQAKPKDKDKKLNDPSLCPYCHGDPALLKAAGLVSHQGFQFSANPENQKLPETTNDIDQFLPTVDFRWLESEHFRLGMSLNTVKVEFEEKVKIEKELTRLHEALPDVSPKLKVLDPWLRIHIYALRCEDLYKRMLELTQTKDSDFPDGTKGWDLKNRYMGEGPYLGMKAKYEVFVVPTKAVFTDFLLKYYGLSTQTTQRWNIIKRDALTVNIRLDESNFRKDSALHGHIAFNLGHNLFDGYRHYSYDTPVWIREGFGHLLEREVDPKYNSFDGSEGAEAEMTSKEDWMPEVKNMIRRGTVPRMAELASLRTFAEMKLTHHFAEWSMLEFIAKKHPEGLTCLLNQLKGRTTPKGDADGSHMLEAQRDAFQSCLKMNYAQFDQAWQAYVMGIEDPK